MSARPSQSAHSKDNTFPLLRKIIADYKHKAQVTMKIPNRCAKTSVWNFHVYEYVVNSPGLFDSLGFFVSHRSYVT